MEKKTYAALYEYGKSLLEEAGIEDASLDARLLLEHVCGTSHTTLLAHGDRLVSDEEGQQYEELLQQRAKRNPLAYILKEQEFMGLTFHADERVLIPNQDTEILVEEVLTELSDGARILDLCTGSGCIALSLLHYSNGTTAVATDISADALEVAEENVASLGLTERITLMETDLFPAVHDRFEFIVSNPPYIPSKVIEGLAPEVREKEPMLALDGGEDGLIFYRRIVEDAPNYLTGSGYLMVEIGYDQGAAVSELMERRGFKEVQVIKDYSGNDRVVKGCFY